MAMHTYRASTRVGGAGGVEDGAAGQEQETPPPYPLGLPYAKEGLPQIAIERTVKEAVSFDPLLYIRIELQDE